MSQQLDPVMRRFRDEVIRECIDALPKEVWPAVAGFATATPVQNWASVAALRRLLSGTDQPEERRYAHLHVDGGKPELPDDIEGVLDPEPILSRIRRDAAEAGTFTLCERTVQACIDALPVPSGLNAHGVCEPYRICRETLKALLPKPNKAEELVREWNPPARGWAFAAPALEEFAHHLIESGRIA